MGKDIFFNKWIPLLLTVAVALTLFWIGWHRLRIDTDIVATLPLDDPVLSDAATIAKKHPMQDLVVIDLQIHRDKPTSEVPSPEPLAEA